MFKKLLIVNSNPNLLSVCEIIVLCRLNGFKFVFHDAVKQYQQINKIFINLFVLYVKRLTADYQQQQ